MVMESDSERQLLKKRGFLLWSLIHILRLLRRNKHLLRIFHSPGSLPWKTYEPSTTHQDQHREISMAGKGQTPPGESEKTQRGGNTESVKDVNIRDVPTHRLFPSIQSNASRSRDVSSLTINRGKVEKGQVKTFWLNMGIQSLQEDNPSC